jgi:pseudouridine kinase
MNIMRTKKGAGGNIAVIGGATCDITGTLFEEARQGDSNPGRVNMSCGGVGRNIAENLARLGFNITFISAFGTDGFSDELIASCEDLGIDTSLSYTKNGARACTYVNMLDSRGELLLAASDMTLTESFPPDLLSKTVRHLGTIDLMILDANLTEELLTAATEHYNGTIVGEAVSAAKAGRLRSILPRLHAVKANACELAALTGREIRNDLDVAEAGRSLLDEGVERVFVTMGKDGACCIERNGIVRTPGFPANVRSVTGAGDAFCAAIAYGVYHGDESRSILMLGAAMSHITLESPFAVSRDMTEGKAMYVMAELEAQHALADRRKNAGE